MKPEKLTPLFLAALIPGQTFETEGLMLGLTKAPLTWKVKSMNARAGQYAFEVRYMGVKLGDYAVFDTKGQISVEQL